MGKLCINRGSFVFMPMYILRTACLHFFAAASITTDSIYIERKMPDVISSQSTPQSNIKTQITSTRTLSHALFLVSPVVGQHAHVCEAGHFVVLISGQEQPRQHRQAQRLYEEPPHWYHLNEQRDDIIKHGSEWERERESWVGAALIKTCWLKN